MCSPTATAARRPLPMGFVSTLIADGLLIETGVPGVFGKNAAFEAIVRGIDALVEAAAEDMRPELVRFPPVVPRSLIERSGYLAGFPQLIGRCTASRAATRITRRSCAPWSRAAAGARSCRRPTSCSRRRPAIPCTRWRPARCRRTVASWTWRRTASATSRRTIRRACRCSACTRSCGSAAPESCVAFRDEWLSRGLEHAARARPRRAVRAGERSVLRPGRPPARRDPARAGAEVRARRADHVVREADGGRLVQLASGSFRRPVRDSRRRGRDRAHGCVGFGLERITLALLRAHGTAPERWPRAVRSALQL